MIGETLRELVPHWIGRKPGRLQLQKPLIALCLRFVE